MKWELKGDRPIYYQLMEQLKLRILSGLYKAGERIPSVRELAAEAAVNPNTMQKALTELEREGLIFSQRTAGRFITEDESLILNIRNSLAKEQIYDFLNKMQAIGFGSEEAVRLIAQVQKEENK